MKKLMLILTITVLTINLFSQENSIKFYTANESKLVQELTVSELQKSNDLCFMLPEDSVYYNYDRLIITLKWTGNKGLKENLIYFYKSASHKNSYKILFKERKGKTWVLNPLWKGTGYASDNILGDFCSQYELFGTCGLMAKLCKDPVKLEIFINGEKKTGTKQQWNAYNKAYDTVDLFGDAKLINHIENFSIK